MYGRIPRLRCLVQKNLCLTLVPAGTNALWRSIVLECDSSGGRYRWVPFTYWCSRREIVHRGYEELEGSSALVNLITNTYVNYLLDSEMRHHEFSALSRLLARFRFFCAASGGSRMPSQFVRSNRDRREETDTRFSVSAHSEMS